VAGIGGRRQNLRMTVRGAVSLPPPRTTVALVLVIAVCGLVTTSCASPTVARGNGRATGVTALGPDLTITTYASTTTWTTICQEPTIPSSTPKTPITGCPAITLPTVDVHRPNPYDPGYHTIGQLVHDSFIVVLGTLQGPVAGGYLINIEKELAGDTKTTIGLSSALVSALRLEPSHTYVFFYGAEGYPLKGGACIVGGERGVMTYDAATNTVTRLDNVTDSQIPRSQTLDQLESEIQQVEAATARAPEELPPAPVCSSSATGIPAG
jgi:hypothetical protein